MVLKSLASICLFFFSSYVFGQVDPLDDFWDKVEKRKKHDKEKNLDNSVRFEKNILDVFGKNIYVIRQKYVYEKDNKRYVRGSDDSYGVAYGIGISSQQGLITSNHLLLPWRNDESVLIQKGYTPVATEVDIESIVDTISIIQSENSYDVIEGPHSIQYMFKPHLVSNFDAKQPDSLGFLMLFYYEPEKDTIYKRSIEFRPEWKDDVSIVDNQFLSEQLIGGVYFNLDSTADTLRLEISGILNGNQSKDFKLSKINSLLPEKAPGKSRRTIKVNDNPIKEEKQSMSDIGTIEKSRKCKSAKNYRSPKS